MSPSPKYEAFIQFESILKERQRSKTERATNAARRQSKSNPNTLRTLFKLIFTFWRVRIFVIAFVLLLLTAGGAWLFSGSASKTESTLFIEQIQELATLATAEAHVKVVIEQEDNKLFGNEISVNLPGTKRETLLIVPATVMAGVDLKAITSDDIKVNDKEKALEITLPRATLIQDPTIQMDHVKAFSDAGLFRGEMNWDEGFDLAAIAQEEVKKEAIEIGLLESAEKSAEKVLNGFFSNLGYTVKLTFK